LHVLARAHVQGVAVDWRPLFPIDGNGHAALPTYAFQRRRYWLSSQDVARDLAVAATLGQT
jgi:acyl transferase domain-containing protein